MQKITPHLWFDKEAKEAAQFYVSTFGEESKVQNVTTIHDTPSGDADMVSFELLGFPFMAISAGPLFTFNQSISFHVLCKTKERVDELWAALSPGGKALMELGEYPFSKRYGWIQDKYGLSWQLIYAENIKEGEQRIKPILMFTEKVAGKAEEAINFYASLFSKAPDQQSGKTEVRMIMRYNPGEDPDKPGTVRYGDFSLAGVTFGAMDSARAHNFQFNEAISFIVHCETQAEIDYFWGQLSAVPESEQCGWLKDKFGVSWQIVPNAMERLMQGSPEKMARVTAAFLKMKKFDIAELERAANG